MLDNLSKLTLEGKFCTNTFSSDLGWEGLGADTGGGFGEITIGWEWPAGLMGMDVSVGEGLWWIGLILAFP